MKPVDLITGTHPLLSDRTRLAIMAALAAAEGLEFTSLIEALGLTKGNLSSHMRKLEEAGLVAVTKEFADRRPRTTYRCTARGRTEVGRYLARVESVLRGALRAKPGGK